MKSIINIQETCQKSRNSSIELLRIISMIFIVAHHYAVHGIIHIGTNSEYEAFYSGTIINQIFTEILVPGGAIGVAIFFLITGFFSVDKNPSLKRLLCQCFNYAFLSLVILFLFVIFKFVPSYVSIKTLAFNVIKGLFDPAFSGFWWFTSAYCLLIACSPLLNKLLSSINKSGLLLIILLVFISQIVIGYLCNSMFYSFFRAVFFYIVGHFIRKYYFNSSNKINRYFLLMLFMVFWIIYVVLDFVKISYFSSDTALSKLFNLVADLSNNTLITFGAAISLFMFFIDFSYESKWINSIASTTLGVYLLHDSPIIRNVIWELIHTDTVQYQSNFYILYAILSILMIFLICSLIDYLIQKTLLKKEISIVDSLYKRFIDKFMVDR